MKFLIDNWYLFVAVIASGGLLAWPLLRAGSGGVSTAEAVAAINREKGLLIDVREPAEFQSGHAVGSKNFPIEKLESATDLPKNKALPLLVVCATGTRAPRAVDILTKRGYSNVRRLSGGLQAWRDANLPIEKAA